ncbi:MAG: hypothetical protein B6U97_03890 [Candidatus Altiarchaeales archaeon ex4484_96]|nr:MAG: hypothetical protein B6U97_03890 [Candidatus Altiarchaeales archaeon ex4484_96]
MEKKYIFLVIPFFYLSILASAMLNPAAVYCSTLGYEYVSEETDEGIIGYCMLPDGQKVEAWIFLRGEKGLNYSYCIKEGYPARHVEDNESGASYTACILSDGSGVEVTQLMNLSFQETICGDSRWGFPESADNCPQDCLNTKKTPKKYSMKQRLQPP